MPLTVSFEEKAKGLSPERRGDRPLCGNLSGVGWLRCVRWGTTLGREAHGDYTLYGEAFKEIRLSSGDLPSA